MLAEVAPILGAFRRRWRGAVSNDGSRDGAHQRRQMGGGDGTLLQHNYLYGEYLEKEPHRLWGVALLPIQDIGAAAEELERCVRELKMVGGVIPAAGLPRGLGHPM